MKNTITAGDYKGYWVWKTDNIVKENHAYITKPKSFLLGACKLFLAICTVGISLFFTRTKKIPLDKTTVESYEVIGEESQTSATSAVARGAIGAALLGPVGLTAALSAKKKGLHTIALQFKNGKRSLAEVDDEIYKILVRDLF